MAKTKKTSTDPKSKKSLRKEVASTLNEIFTDIKQAVGDKKFDKKVKRASKVLTAGAAKKTKKEAPVKADKKVKPAKAKAPKAKAPKKPVKAKPVKKDKPAKKSKDTGAAPATEATTS